MTVRVRKYICLGMQWSFFLAIYGEMVGERGISWVGYFPSLVKEAIF